MKVNETGEQNVNGEEEGDTEAGRREEGAGESPVKMGGLSRKEKRKAIKKMKRKQMRKEMAEKEREEEETKLDDPEEQARMKEAEEEEARRRERELKEFEERERAWIEAMELKKRQEEAEWEEEEKRRTELKESGRQQIDEEKEGNGDDEWEYVEEGPPEVIFQGNEIILRKKKVRVPKKQAAQQAGGKEDADWPTSNPLAPQSEAFADYQGASSAQQALENVAQQVPNFGTEQDKAHCPFHLKTGACRFGQRCNRVHFYPDKSCTLLMKNMYNGPGLAWEQDEGLEYTDEEVDRCYEEFYEDVHTEFLKFGEIVNFKVCKNGSFHLRGNVYVHYKSLESAVLALQSVNGRYFAGKQVKCEYVNVTKWKVAICGEFMKSRLKTCSRGTACNFIHCFRNPGGDYEWADLDKPPPRYWMKKMATLFGYSDEYEKQMEHEHMEMLKDSGRIMSADLHRRRLRRSRSRETDHTSNRSGPSPRNHGDYSDFRVRTREFRHRKYKDYGRDESSNHSSESDRDRDVYDDRYNVKKTSERESKWSKRSPDFGVDENRICESFSDENTSDRGKDMKIHSDYKRESSSYYGLKGSQDHEDPLANGEERKTRRKHMSRSSRQRSREGSIVNYEDREKNHGIDSTQERADRDRDKYTHHWHKGKGSKHYDQFTDSSDAFVSKKKRTHDFDSTGEGSIEDMDENICHRHKRKDSRDCSNYSEEPNDHGNSRKRNDHDFIGYGSDTDRDKSRRHSHKRSSGLWDEVREESLDDRGKSKEKRKHDAERLDGDREGNPHSCDMRRSSENDDKVSESPDGHRKYSRRHNDADSSEERSDGKRRRKRHHHHGRRRSGHHYKVSESSEGYQVTHTDSKDDKFDRDMEVHNRGSGSLKGTNKSLEDDDLMCEGDQNIDKLGRWKP